MLLNRVPIALHRTSPLRSSGSTGVEDLKKMRTRVKDNLAGSTAVIVESCVEHGKTCVTSLCIIHDAFMYERFVGTYTKEMRTL